MSISQYIREHEKLSKMDFITVYDIIIELLKDDKINWDFNV